MPERSLDFARDDVAEVALSQHIRCTLREINPFPHTVISSAARNLPCTLLFLAPFAKGFPFSALSCSLRRSIPVFCYHTYDIIPSCKKDPSTSLGMTIREAFSKHIRCTLREINPFPIPSFRAQREIFLALCSFLLPSQKVSHFPLSHIGRYTGVQERSRASLGMTLREYRSLTLPIYFPCNNDTREAPSTLAALLFFMRRATPLNPTT